MNQDIDAILTKYRSKGVIVDTNLLLLYIVGSCDPERIMKFKKTMKFNKEDFLLVKRFVKLFKSIRTTPNILTEVSNHLNQLPESLWQKYSSVFSQCIDDFLEIYEPSSNLSKHECFKKYGLTDTAVMKDAKNNFLVLTDDFPLSGYLSSAGVAAINFNHLRMINWK